MSFPYIFAALSFVAALVVRYAFRRARTHSIAQLPGPPPGSWLVGNMPDILRPENVGDADFEWTQKFGASVHFKGSFGRDVLFTADPKALQYILNTSGYRFPKSPDIRFIIRLITGKGIVWADGNQHARHRKIMDPAFSHSSIRAFLPLFREKAQSAVANWRDVVAQSTGTSSVVDIPSWLARLTLDAMGAAFDYEFGALSGDTNNELTNTYKNLFADAYHNRSDYTIAFQDICGYLPDWMIAVFQSIPNNNVQRLRDYIKVALRVAQSLVDRQLQSLASGNEGGKDLMGLLVKANLSQDTKGKLENDELLAQLTTLLVAGHETIATTVTWTLYELSRHPQFQAQVRAEITAARNRAAERGNDALGVGDFESMNYLLALIKETLRYHPALPNLTRLADHDDILPLSTHQKTKAGDVITEIPVSRGQRIMLSIAAYNRLPVVWGKDADMWNPERFLNGGAGNEKTGLGVLANLATFSSGVRNCIGWRFALLEIQVILVELIENFEFSPPPGNVGIIRAATSLMSPMVKGSNTGRIELPLTITPLI